MVRRLLFHFFVPHKDNNHRAQLLHPWSLAFVGIILVGFQMFLGFTQHALPQILGIATDIRVEKLLEETNYRRKLLGLNPLAVSPELAFAAHAKAEDMFAKNYWAHYSPSGTTPWDFILNAKYHYVYAGENLAKDFQESGAVVDAWMASPTHRANILRPEYKDIGFAIVNGKLNGEETTLVVQMFGTRSPESTNGPVEKNVASGQPAETEQKNLGSSLLGLGAVVKAPLVDLRLLSRVVSLTFASLLFLVFVSDGLFLWRKHILRASGHNLAHLIFLVSLLGSIWFTSLGVIF